MSRKHFFAKYPLTFGEWSTKGISQYQVRTHGAERCSLTISLEPRRGEEQRTRWRHREFTQVQATVRCKTLLLLVWIALLGEVQYNGELVERFLCVCVLTRGIQDRVGIGPLSKVGVLPLI